MTALLIFDCDGVLVDSENIALRILSETMGEYGTAMSVEACRDAFMGRHNADIVRGMEARVGRPLPGEAGRLRDRMLARMARELQPIPGVADVLRRLHGPRCVASSSDPERLRLTLGWTGLLPFFGEAIFSGVDVPRGKPAPDLFLHAAASMGVAPGDAIVIEDSVLGVQAGVAAGMRVIGFAGGSHCDAAHPDRLREAGASAVVATMSDMLPHLEHASADALPDS